MADIQLKNITKAYGNNEPVISGLDLTIEDGSFTVLLGASGCGKSTLLRMVAGIEPKNEGDIFIDGVNVEGVEPGDRNIAMVFQNYALYPTMTVRDNIEFGLKNMKVPKAERKERTDAVAQTVGLTEYLDRKPQNLSGGQRQRVALARAIVKNPKVFLMDEPLSNLDAKLRTQIRTELIELYRKLKTTFVYVTHDQVEAMSMGTKIVLMKDGEIQQIGDPMEIYDRPANIYTAKFIGSPPMNVVTAQYANEQANHPLYDGLAHVGFRPEAMIPMDEAYTPDDFVFSGEITAREILGDQILYKVRLSESGEIATVKTFNKEALEYGTAQFYVKKQSLNYFDAQENRMSVDA